VYWSLDLTGINIALSTTGVNEGYPRLSLNDSTDGQFDLVINSTQSEDAGSYGCTESFDTLAVELALLGKCFVSVCY